MSKVISKIVVPDSNEATGYALYNVKDANAIPASEKGIASGVATLDNTGKIPSSQIPSGIVSLLSDWNQADSTAGDYIKNKPTSMPASDVSSWAKKSTKPSYTKSEVGLGNVGNFLAVSTEASQGLSETQKTNARSNIGAGTSSFSGSYNDLINKPTIPSVGNAEIEIQKNGTKVGSFTTNQSGSKVTMNITVPTGTAANKDVPTSGNASTSQVVMGNDSRLTDSRNANDVYSWAKASSKPTYTASEVGAIPTSAKGAASGVASLDSSGKVPSSQLPSYVDDVLEYDAKSDFPATGEAGKIYINKSNNTTWRWSGTAYVQIKGDLVIGTTSGTAADGGTANTHYSNTSNPHSVTKSQVGLGSVVNTGDSATPVSGGTTKFTTGGAYTELAKKVDKVTGKGLSTNDYTTDEKNKLSGIASGAEVNQNAFSNIVVGNTTIAADGKTDTFTLVAGSNITLTPDATNDKVTIAASQPTVNNATLTIQKNGTTVKTFTANASSDVTANITVPTKVSELTNDSGYTTNAGTITGIKMNGSSKGTSGVVDLGTVITAHLDISGKVDKTTTVNGHALSGNISVTKSDIGLGNVGNFKAVSTVASQGLSDTEKANARSNIGAGTSSFSGSYNDLSNKPTIPAAANNGTYTVKTLVGSTTTNVSDFTANQSSADDVTFVLGSNVTITPDTTNRKITIAAKDTTYSAATTSAAGLMSAADKTKLDGVATGANNYSLPTASSSTLGGVKVGTNLSISNGVLSATNTWNAASSSQAGYVPAATKGKFLHSNASTGNLEWVDDNNTTYSSKSAASGGTAVSLCTTGEKYTWNNKQAALVSGTNIKTINGTSILGSGNIEIQGGGGGEVITISLTQNTGSASDLNGATIVVRDNTEGAYLLSTTWNGTAIEFEVPVPVNYTVTVGSRSGYQTPSAVTYNSRIGRSRNLTFQYKTEVVTVTVNTNKSGVTAQGQTVTINGVNTTVPASGTVTQKVPFGTTYSVSVNRKSGYNTPANQSFTANTTSRSVTMTYTQRNSGVYILDTNNELFTTSEWSSYSHGTAVGVAVLSSAHNFVVSKDGVIKSFISNNTYLPCSGATAITNETTARQRYSGKADTAIMVTALTDSSSIHRQCSNKTFANGKTGYLPSLGEMTMIVNNLTEINSCITAVGGTNIETSYFFWTSTYYGIYSNKYYSFWALSSANVSRGQGEISEQLYGIPCCEY